MRRDFDRSREHTPHRRTTSRGWLLLIVIALGMFGWYIVYTGRGSTLEYDAIDAAINKQAVADISRVQLPENQMPLMVPDMSLFASNRPWMYVSRTAPLPASYQPADLVTVELPHAASDTPVRLQPRPYERLGELFAAASRDGRSLMIASAYRSVVDQQALYDNFVAKRGEAAAKQYVAQPGTSEHHTGLAVDVDDASPACQRDGDACELSYESIAWLAEHAPDYGFIIRFPATKQPVTGTAYEPWHLRYVGVVLARQLTASGLAFDEFIEQVAPGRLDNRN